MKIHVSQQVNVEGENFPRTMYKEFESSIIPSLGMRIEDIGWKKPYDYEVVEVIINYEENRVFVSVAQYNNVIPADKIENFFEIQKHCGWKKLGE